MLLRLPPFCSASAVFAEACTDGLDVFSTETHFFNHEQCTWQRQQPSEDHIGGCSVSDIVPLDLNACFQEELSDMNSNAHTDY